MERLKIERRLEEKERRGWRELLWPHVGSGYCLGQHSFRTVPSSQNVLLDSDDREFRFHSQTDLILAMSLASSVNLVELFPHSKPQFFHLQNGDNKSVYSPHALLVDL